MKDLSWTMPFSRLRITMPIIGNYPVELTRSLTVSASTCNFSPMSMSPWVQSLLFTFVVIFCPRNFVRQHRSAVRSFCTQLFILASRVMKSIANLPTLHHFYNRWMFWFDIPPQSKWAFELTGKVESIRARYTNFLKPSKRYCSSITNPLDANVNIYTLVNFTHQRKLKAERWHAWSK